MKDKEYNFDEIVQKAFQQRQSPQSDVSECLSDDTIKKLYTGRLSEDQRQRALEHLDKCQRCSADLAAYAEIVQSQQQPASMASLAGRLKTLKAVMPKLKSMLNQWDLKSLTAVVADTVRQVKKQTAPQIIDEKLQQIFEAIQLRVPQLAVQKRGKQKQQTATAKEVETLSNQLSEQLKEMGLDYSGVLTGKDSAQAEMKLFDRLDESLKLQAASIRDACQNYYERENLCRIEPAYISYGASHAREMLAKYAKLLDMNMGFSDEFTDFIIYCSIYCYDLGMYNTEADFSEMLDKRGLKTREILLAKSRQLGFNSQKIAALTADACCFDNLKTKLPESQSVFFKGQTRNFPALAAAALIKILDLLAVGSYRLIKPEVIAEEIFSDGFLREYLKHQLIYKIDVTSECIKIDSVIQYEYPFDDKFLRGFLEQTLVNEFNELNQTVKYAGLKLPPVKLDIKQTMLKQPDPLYNQLGNSSIFKDKR